MQGRGASSLDVSIFSYSANNLLVPFLFSSCLWMLGELLTRKTTIREILNPGQHLIANPECAKTCTDYNFRIIGQPRSSFHLSVLESVYIKTEKPVLCRQKEFVFSFGLFK